MISDHRQHDPEIGTLFMQIDRRIQTYWKACKKKKKGHPLVRNQKTEKMPEGQQFSTDIDMSYTLTVKLSQGPDI